MVPEFDGGDRGRPISGGGIPPGHIAVEHREDGSWRTRPAGEIIGWRVVCDCYQRAYQTHPKHWVSDQLWTRVPSPTQHDPDRFRVYAADDDVEDIAWTGDVEQAAHALWRREHIDDLDAAGAITCALSVLRAAQAALDQAVIKARQRGLPWSKIGEAAGMSPQAAHERWKRRASQGDSVGTEL
ncbi:AsnC family protein [Mycobacterium eburneum]|nr:AsnC family protein [Mycobacterium eburneum]TDH46669.1 AsnC family protein [Mycobacterium eburneum]